MISPQATCTEFDMTGREAPGTGLCCWPRLPSAFSLIKSRRFPHLFESSHRLSPSRPSSLLRTELCIPGRESERGHGLGQASLRDEGPTARWQGGRGRFYTNDDAGRGTTWYEGPEAAELGLMYVFGKVMGEFLEASQELLWVLGPPGCLGRVPSCRACSLTSPPLG